MTLEGKTSVELGGLKIEQEDLRKQINAELTAFSVEQKEAAFDSVWKMLLDMEERQSKKEIDELKSQVLSGNLKVDVTDNHGTITINQENNIYNINIEGAKVDIPSQPVAVVHPEVPAEDPSKKEETLKPASAQPVSVQPTSAQATPDQRQATVTGGPDPMSDQAKPDKPLKPVPVTPIPSREEIPSPTSQEIQHTPQTTASEGVTELQTIPETPEGRYDEMRDILTSLNRELVPDASGNIVLTGAQMKKLNRISLLRAPFFGAGVPKELAEAMGRSDIITADDLKNERTINAARKRIKKQLKDEKKYNKALGKLVDQYIDYANAKNSTNYTLNKVAALNRINEVLENGEYIGQSFAFMPEVSPLILNICQKGNREKLAANQSIQVMNNKQTINVFPESVSSAGSAAGYLATCGAGGYANIAEKWLTENTKMSQGQARNMLNSLGSLGLIAGVVGIGYWLFTKKDGDGRKFSFPSLGKLAAVIGIPMLANYTSQMTTGNSLLDNIHKAWTTGEFPWSSPDSLPAHEALAAQQVMGQFVLLGVPKSIIKKYGTFSSGKMTKIDLGGLKGYYEELEKDANTSSEQKARIATQLAAIDNISKTDSAKTALNNYIERLAITENELNSDPNGYLDARLGEAAEKYNKLDTYIKGRGLLIDQSKKDKVVNTLFTEKEVKDEVFDKLKEEGCFIPNPDDNRYKEISKLSVSADKKIKIAEAFASLASEGTKYGQMSLKVDGGKVKLKSVVKLDSGEVKEHEISLNPNLTIDGFVDAGGTSLVLMDERELLRAGLLVNLIKAQCWDETPEAAKKDAPFELSGGLKFWESVQFAKHDGSKVVLSSFLPFISEMASNHPTIEKDNNRQFFVGYLNKLWKSDHTL